MKEYKPYMIWVLIVGGLLWGYEGLMGVELQEALLGMSVSNILEIIVGVVALLVAYMKLTMSGKKR